MLVCKQNAEFGSRPHFLSHHISLPKTSAEMAAVEKFLQLQDTVPCKIRAKRGCATHPRSIAERVKFLLVALYMLIFLMRIVMMI